MHSMFCVKTHGGLILSVRSSLLKIIRYAALSFFSVDEIKVIQQNQTKLTIPFCSHVNGQGIANQQQMDQQSNLISKSLAGL